MIMLKLKPFLYISTLIQRNNMTSPSLSETSKLSMNHNDLLSEENIEPTIMAWVWTDYRSELPQTNLEAEELDKLPIPMAWVWCYYSGELQQTAEEKLSADQLGRKDNAVVIFNKPAKFHPSQIAASLAAGFIGVTLLGQAVAMSML
jgi:hypothetical protein